MDKTVAALVQELKKLSTEVASDKDLANVAAVSAGAHSRHNSMRQQAQSTSGSLDCSQARSRLPEEAWGRAGVSAVHCLSCCCCVHTVLALVSCATLQPFAVRDTGCVLPCAVLVLLQVATVRLAS